MSEELIVKCPICQTEVIWNKNSPYRPFCSKRCQLIDLGEWADEGKRIPSQGDSNDSDDWSEMPSQEPQNH
ncbi:DNA gyrase inhibitor YacG [Proteus myxofaciens]|uniref:DNA gyrase inhibitor YacG n=1 Tax=Proteus myxofaciens ATCC 19692 TaxID=1354337 RepID=A0A198GCK9_9GAMM|nr:DNA gyrase inhibitor YacG [Proteus myxofaciens]OAT34828.1 zinc-binding protein [Proteus myxofaciens ATCC 19692]